MGDWPSLIALDNFGAEVLGQGQFSIWETVLELIQRISRSFWVLVPHCHMFTFFKDFVAYLLWCVRVCVCLIFNFISERRGKEEREIEKSMMRGNH